MMTECMVHNWPQAVEAWLNEAGSLPVNVKFLLEGQEEVMSPHLTAFLHKHKCVTGRLSGRHYTSTSIAVSQGQGQGAHSLSWVPVCRAVFSGGLLCTEAGRKAGCTYYPQHTPRCQNLPCETWWPLLTAVLPVPSGQLDRFATYTQPNIRGTARQARLGLPTTPTLVSVPAL